MKSAGVVIGWNTLGPPWHMIGRPWCSVWLTIVELVVVTLLFGVEE